MDESDDLAHLVAVGQVLERLRRLLEVEHPVDDRMRVVLGDERVQRFEVARARTNTALIWPLAAAAADSNVTCPHFSAHRKVAWRDKGRRSGAP